MSGYRSTITGLCSAAAITAVTLAAPFTLAVASAHPGIGWGLPGPGLGGWGGPLSGAGLLPGAGYGLPGPGLGGVGGPASGLGVYPGVGVGLPGPGLI